MRYSLATRFDQSPIVLELSLPPQVRLKVNGTVRAEQSQKNADAVDFYLTTALQIGYEFHAQVTARVTFAAEHVDAWIRVNGTEILRERIVLTGGGRCYI